MIKREYYENGSVMYETPYRNGKIHGVDKWFYKNGNIKLEIPYENGIIHGIVKKYNKNGNVISLRDII